ncbi:MAG: hypothetical protein IPJ61_04835 [Tessaracoccus sp.]|uniref:hypothetical protein n=1 Tax=Tessaracoccus sp. TaxID=1971211 RepID=UPI001EBBE5E9|nr:hypothetical protein [Tessaracoccus sp.]MBK7820403.1 hypothetical protein [Tessaracoccus sp.]
MATPGTPGEEPKSIFVISPIGKVDDDGFDFTKLFLDEIVKPAAKEAGGFKAPVRADEVRAPGSITAKVVRDIVHADVCIADLTGRNPNVMYEVAIAHAADKPVILLQQEAGGPPFDFTDERVIRYSTRADEANPAREALTDHLMNARHEDSDEQLRNTMHPVRMVFRDLQTRASATDPEQAILERLDAVTRGVQVLESVVMESMALSDRRSREELRERDHRYRIASHGKLISSQAGLIERIDQLAKQLLDRGSYEYLSGHLRSDARDMDALERLYMLLRTAETEVDRAPSEQSSALREAVALATSLPPF